MTEQQKCMAYTPQGEERIPCDSAGELPIALEGELYMVCKGHFYGFNEQEAGKGLEHYIDFALANFGEEHAEAIVGQRFPNSSQTVKDKIAQNAEMVQMFTYGILKYPTNIQRDGGTNIVENCTVSGQLMHLYNNSFPITRATGADNHRIYGTLFSVPKRTLKQYDRIEGYNPRRPEHENMYNRKTIQVVTPTGETVEAQMYIANPAYFSGWYTEHTLIPSGNFDNKPTVNRYANTGRAGDKKPANRKGGKRKERK